MSIPKDYFERVYSGWLGKIIGIRLGAPIEGWSYERIRNIYGEVTGYPVSYKNFAADDDSNGPLFFIRALEDCKDLSAFSASDVADALLNYAPYEHGFFWWGRLRHLHGAHRLPESEKRYSRPRSGSVEQNGATMAEQIGGQIFIDPLGPGSPGKSGAGGKAGGESSKRHSWRKRGVRRRLYRLLHQPGLCGAGYSHHPSEGAHLYPGGLRIRTGSKSGAGLP